MTPDATVRRDRRDRRGAAQRAVAGIVLAGGRSRRFGRDKLAASMPDGRTVLTHAAEAVASVVDLVAVVISPEGPIPDALPPNVLVVRDAQAFDGPVAGILAGLEALGGTAESIVVVAGGDMPWMLPDVLRLLVDALEADPDATCARLGSPTAVAAATVDEPTALLPCALRLGAARAAARSAFAEDDRRVHRLLGRLATAVVDGQRWRTIDPDGWTIRDVDRPADLDDRPL
ncbi:MAG: molybdenum cofactor guanylyltransferase [Chloroflexi bacterium]|nr:molybdenum cofactor guanylyltransferase [Chloroflexota bacterium]